MVLVPDTVVLRPSPCVEAVYENGRTVEKRLHNGDYVFYSDLGEQFENRGHCELFSGGCNCCYRQWCYGLKDDPEQKPFNSVLALLVPSCGTAHREAWHFMPCMGPRDMSHARRLYGEGQHAWSKRELEHTERSTHCNRAAAYYGLMWLTSMKQWLWTEPEMERPRSWIHPFHRDFMCALLPVITGEEEDRLYAKRLADETRETVLTWRWRKVQAAEEQQQQRRGRSNSRGPGGPGGRPRSKSAGRRSQSSQEKPYDPVRDWDQWKSAGSAPWGPEEYYND